MTLIIPHLHQDADRQIVCRSVTESPLPPTIECSLAECQRCPAAVWLGPGHRQLITEVEVRDLDYTILCYACAHAGAHARACGPVHGMDAGNEADTLRMMRGAPPRRELTIVTWSELTVIRQAMGMTLRWD